MRSNLYLRHTIIYCLLFSSLPKFILSLKASWTAAGSIFIGYTYYEVNYKNKKEHTTFSISESEAWNENILKKHPSTVSKIKEKTSSSSTGSK